MRNFSFEEQVGKEEFLALARTPGVKSHFEQSYAWGELSRRRGRVPYYVGVREDGRLVASALLLQKSLVMGYSYFYVPRGFTMDYSDPELLRFFTESVHRFCKARKSIYFKIDPDIKLHTVDLEGQVIEGEENSALVADLKKMGYRHRPLTYLFETEQPRFTFRLSLEDEMGAIEERYGKTTRNILKQTEKNEIEVSIGEAADIREFTRLIQLTEKRQDFYSHDADYYPDFYETLAKDDMVALYLGHLDIPRLIQKVREEQAPLLEEKEKLLASQSRKAAGKLKEVENRLAAFGKQIAQLEDKPQEKVTISAYLMVYYDDKAWTLYAGNDMDYSKFYGNYAVYRQAIRDAHERGYKIFDGFGSVGRTGVDEALDGLYEFKKKWGGELTEFLGEFDYVENRLMYFLYSKLIPLYHKRMQRRLHAEVQQRD